MTAVALIDEAAFDPDVTKRLKDIHGRIWGKIADEYPVDDQDVTEGQLARMIIGLHTAGTDQAELEDKALTLMHAARQL